jgi:hypothetical protein
MLPPTPQNAIGAKKLLRKVRLDLDLPHLKVIIIIGIKIAGSNI